MIQSLMLCGIGLLAGCLLMLTFFPVIHDRAVRLTSRQIAEATPMTVNEIQADKDHLRAEFAMSIRRLEIGMEGMRTKAIARSADKQNAEISRLKVELDRKMALVFALRTREEVRKNAVRRVVKILLYLFVRSRRRDAPPLFRLDERQTWETDHRTDQQADHNELAATAAAIAALNLRRRQAVSNNY
jgi:hypothetical protein